MSTHPKEPKAAPRTKRIIQAHSSQERVMKVDEG
jgi:hypothetical protein